MTSFGPTLLSKVLALNNKPESSLNLVFHYAERAGLPLLDPKDLRAVISYLVGIEGNADLAGLGGLSKATAGVILADLIGLEDQGDQAFFGEPEFETTDLLRTGADGRGILTSSELADRHDRPQLFSTFFMWLLADLFHELPEIGDVDKPKLVFFDEARPAVRRRERGLPRCGHPNRPVDPVQGRRHLLHHAEPRTSRIRAPRSLGQIEPGAQGQAVEASPLQAE